MIKHEYNKKIIRKGEYDTKITDLELKSVRNKCRDHLNKTKDKDLVHQVYELFIQNGMKV